DILSLFQEEPEVFLKSLDDLLLKQKNLSREQIDLLVNERTEARTKKDFKKADQLRDKLTALGIELQDAPQGTTWEVSK
ncbi:MAG: cysteine--tRNA ligase, partial [Bdellovibrionales bacterium]|nr:cysteine--tRNA ligase [Bdellovibrionales bacterium]